MTPMRIRFPQNGFNMTWSREKSVFSSAASQQVFKSVCVLTSADGDALYTTSFCWTDDIIVFKITEAVTLNDARAAF